MIIVIIEKSVKDFENIGKLVMTTEEIQLLGACLARLDVDDRIKPEVKEFKSKLIKVIYQTGLSPRWDLFQSTPDKGIHYGHTWWSFWSDLFTGCADAFSTRDRSQG